MGFCGGEVGGLCGGYVPFAMRCNIGVGLQHGVMGDGMGDG